MTTADLKWRCSPFPEPARAKIDQSLCDSLVDVAASNPNAVAVIDQGRCILFSELAGRVAGLAQQIEDLNAPPGPVALLQSPCIDAVVAWFACSLAGRPFLLLEPHNPPGRNAELLMLAGAAIVIHDEETRPPPQNPAAVRPTLIPDGRQGVLVKGTGLKAAEPALIFPTSGSTGEPKLVVYSMMTLQAKIQASIGLIGPSPSDIVLIAGSHGNFGFLHHALVFVLAGGGLCLFDVRRYGLTPLFEAITTLGVGHIRFTPSLFRTAAATPEARGALRRLRAVRFSGEPLLWNDVALARRLLDPGCVVQNIYGSTESAIFIWTDLRITPLGTGVAPIGQIYPLWQFAIRDDGEAVDDAAQEGRLLIRSRFQALGDWKDRKVHTDRFDIDPTDAGLRQYDTGDIVRRLSSGDLAMVGRADRVVKVNGYRVSLAEVEAHLRAMPGCGQAAVIAKENERGLSLAAFFTLNADELGPQDARDWLRGRLPAPMIPAQLSLVDDLPMLPGGKLDYRRLSDQIGRADPTCLEPRPPNEANGDLERLSRLWNEVLENPAGANDPDSDFFDLGGDSLRWLELQLSVERAFDRELNYQAFLDRPTFRQLAALAAVDGLSPRAQLGEDGDVVFHLVRAAQGPSKGVVLAMPGWGGGPRLHSWLASNMFDGFDLWSCTFVMRGGNIMDDRRWLAAAQRIAAAIRAGDGPAPAFLVGFSIAGYVAWLVERLLGDSALRPQGVICVDVQPMHRHPEYKGVDVDEALQAAAKSPKRPMLLIHREGLLNVRSPPQQLLWSPADADLERIAVRTIEHGDMDSAVVLAAVRPAVRLFMAEPGARRTPADSALRVETYSGKLYDLISEATTMSSAQVEQLVAQRPKSGSRLSLSALQYLVIIHADLPTAQQFVTQQRTAQPDWIDVQYAEFALARLTRGGWTLRLKSNNDPTIESIWVVAKALRLRPKATRGWPNPLNWTGVAAWLGTNPPGAFDQEFFARFRRTLSGAGRFLTRGWAGGIK